MRQEQEKAVRELKQSTDILSNNKWRVIARRTKTALEQIQILRETRMDRLCRSWHRDLQMIYKTLEHTLPHEKTPTTTKTPHQDNMKAAEVYNLRHTSGTEASTGLLVKQPTKELETSRTQEGRRPGHTRVSVLPT